MGEWRSVEIGEQSLVSLVPPLPSLSLLRPIPQACLRIPRVAWGVLLLASRLPLCPTLHALVDSSSCTEVSPLPLRPSFVDKGMLITFRIMEIEPASPASPSVDWEEDSNVSSHTVTHNRIS